MKGYTRLSRQIFSRTEVVKDQHRSNKVVVRHVFTCQCLAGTLSCIQSCWHSVSRYTEIGNQDLDKSYFQLKEEIETNHAVKIW